MQNTEDFEDLQALRVEISQGLLEVQVLLQKIYELEENCEIMTLSDIAKRICQDGRKNCEKLECAIEKIKDNREDDL